MTEVLIIIIISFLFNVLDEIYLYFWKKNHPKWQEWLRFVDIVLVTGFIFGLKFIKVL